ncbi:MAG TPA: RNase adapter RapZ [Flavisolibacter sp.]|nr:RNase adapter RapZ [Flavisolibacter sp.]
MQEMINAVSQLYKSWAGKEPVQVDVLPQSGSDRRYFRLYSEEGKTFIGTYGLNVPENEAFIYFADHFRRKSLSVPEILAVSYDKTIYLQQDFGNKSLLNILEAKGFTQEVYDLFRESLHQLARLQVLGDEGLNYKKCLTNEEFGKQAIMADLLYFKYYFLDALQRPYDKQKLIDDFEALSNYLTHTEYKYFMFRDFQSRNILVTGPLQTSPNGGGLANTQSLLTQDSINISKSSKSEVSAADGLHPLGEGRDGGCIVHFIDFQGGMKGAPQYDVASMIWQARANLPDEWKHNLLEDYIDSFETIIQNTIDRDVFRSQYNGYVLIRLLQVLGAYGFRGLFERKAQFLTSIPLALKNLKWFFENQSLGIVLPEFKRVLTICTDDEIIERFTPIRADDSTPLTVKICSFSYKKGTPADASGNGGGFVFDCRGIENPGRYDEYKEHHGRDKSVMEFLERQTKMQTFLNSVFDLVDISVEDYIKRGFTNLAVNFGCTGGQHRSVYAADALARHLRNKYKVKIELCHREQEEKNWINGRQR